MNYTIEDLKKAFIAGGASALGCHFQKSEFELIDSEMNSAEAYFKRYIEVINEWYKHCNILDLCNNNDCKCGINKRSC